jgi:DNA-binding transcriptional LysR family regulator
MNPETKARARIRQLEAFHAVMQTGSVTRAAELLQISQPSASKLLQELERGTGVALFQRVRKRLVPTPEGRRLGREVEGLFLKLSHIEHVANEMRAIGPGELRIAALPALGLALVPRQLSAFRRSRPEIRAALTVASSQRVVEMVAAGEADVGFAYPVPGTPPTLERHGLGVLEAVAVLPRGHKLGQRKLLKPADFEGEAFVSLGREDRTRDNMEAVFGASRLGAEAAIETPFAAVACELVASGAGVALVDPITAHFFRDRVLVRPLRPSFGFNFGVLAVAGQPRSAIAQDFVELVSRAVAAIHRAQR